MKNNRYVSFRRKGKAIKRWSTATKHRITYRYPVTSRCQCLSKQESRVQVSYIEANDVTSQVKDQAIQVTTGVQPSHQKTDAFSDKRSERSKICSFHGQFLPTNSKISELNGISIAAPHPLHSTIRTRCLLEVAIVLGPI